MESARREDQRGPGLQLDAPESSLVDHFDRAAAVEHKIHLRAQEMNVRSAPALSVGPWGIVNTQPRDERASRHLYHPGSDVAVHGVWARIRERKNAVKPSGLGTVFKARVGSHSQHQGTRAQ